MSSRSEQTVDTGSRTVDPVIPKATSLLINSGNIVSADRLKKRSNTSPQDELVEVINGTFWSWLSTIDSNAYQEQNSVECRHPVFEKLKETEHDDISISVKLFLNSLDTEIVSQSIKKILDEIGAKHIDTLIVSFPDKVFVHDQLPAQLVMPIWSIVQECVDSQVVSTAGLSDFNAIYLEQFCNFLQDKNRKPSLNQVNLSSCCKMPEDLVEFAKINNIQLTTHLDPRELLSEESFQSCLKKSVHEYDSHGWMPQWQARYTLIQKGRGIVKSKGYLVYCQRMLRYTK